MNHYYSLARIEEKHGNLGSALLFYLTSFCETYNAGCLYYPIGATNKIRRLQLNLGLTDDELYSMVRSYGPLTDQECRYLLRYSISGCITGIHAILRN